MQRLYDINVFGTLRAIQAFVPAMRERRAGAIVNLSSIVGRVGSRSLACNSSTKWAIEGLSELLRIELARFGIRVVLIEPGMIGTGSLDAPRNYITQDDPYLPIVRKRPAREQMTSPETLARIIADAVEKPEQHFGRWLATMRKHCYARFRNGRVTTRPRWTQPTRCHVIQGKSSVEAV